MFATSLNSTTAPALDDLTTTSRNCATVCSLLRALIVAFNCCPALAGSEPSWPTDTSVFWASSAALISDGIKAYFSSLAGSIQMRMAKPEPRVFTSPTPLTRLIWSSNVLEM